MFPRTLALAASQIEATISLFLATSLSAGSLTIYYLAQRLADLPVRILGTSVGQAALPILSLQIAQNKKDQFKKTLNESLSQIFYLALPVTGFFLVMRLQIVRFAYGAKSFPWDATLITSKTLAAITFSIFFQSAIQLLIRGFYALHDTKTPFFISLTCVIINVGLSILFVLSYNMGIFGLALAYSISNLINFLLLFFSLSFGKEKLIDKNLAVSWSRMFLAAVIASFVCWLSIKLLDNYVFKTTRTLPLLFLTIISTATGTATYLWISKIFNFTELSVIFSLGKKLNSWKNTLFSVGEIIEPHSGTGTGS
jgi:putative peptidoglycan lipid II flippase